MNDPDDDIQVTIHGKYGRGPMPVEFFDGLAMTARSGRSAAPTHRHPGGRTLDVSEADNNALEVGGLLVVNGYRALQCDGCDDITIIEGRIADVYECDPCTPRPIRDPYAATRATASQGMARPWWNQAAVQESERGGSEG